MKYRIQKLKTKKRKTKEYKILAISLWSLGKNRIPELDGCWLIAIS